MEQLKYGWVHGGKTSVPWQTTDAEVLYSKGGRFMFRNVTTGLLEVADTTDAIVGWAESGDISSTSSDILNIIVDLTAVFSIPLIYDNSSYTVNYAQTIQGECCDLKVSTYQYANPTAATKKSLLIVGGLAATGTTITTNDGYLLVMINPSALGNLGVGA